MDAFQQHRKASFVLIPDPRRRYILVIALTAFAEKRLKLVLNGILLILIMLKLPDFLIYYVNSTP
jgi:hypothetical protein